MSDYYDETVFDEEPADDLDAEPDDGRDGLPPAGSSDSPETMDEIDPLHKHRYLLDDDLSAPEDLDDDEVPEPWDSPDDEPPMSPEEIED